MNSHIHSAFGRLEIVETGRRRRWSDDEKARIVLESLVGPRLVSATARRHGVSRAQLLAWRRSLKVEREEAVVTPSFVPAIVEPELVASLRSRSRPSSTSSGRIEIVLSRGRRVIVDADVDAEALSRIIDLLERR